MALRRSCKGLHLLFTSTHPTKLSLFCLGSTAGAVIVGSAGEALESCNKAEADAMIVRSRPDMLAVVSSTMRRVDGGQPRVVRTSSARLIQGGHALRGQYQHEATLHPHPGRATSLSSLKVGTGATCQTRPTGATLTNNKEVLPSHTMVSMQRLTLSGLEMNVMVSSIESRVLSLPFVHELRA